MKPQTLNHMKGGKVFGITMMTLSIVLVTVLIILFTEKNVEFMSAIMLLAVSGFVVWASFRFYKPAFTEITFTEKGITSKTHFQSQTLELKDIKGIWFIRLPYDNREIEEYSPTGKSLKGCLVIIGSIKRFEGATFLGANGASILVDSFSKGYTTILYRKGVDNILSYYYSKVEEGSV